eukprot:TRINITY_DN14918_c0_g1_i1.p1 TRINITY_DN14918_c0_g1~~TRINITY_DN14918_c0_g1_i1.p1  ORF type:complete len:274 (-),score=23.85 TRINITY_DN14918_c0_g1_i1:3-824(-)
MDEENGTDSLETLFANKKETLHKPPPTFNDKPKIDSPIWFLDLNAPDVVDFIGTNKSRSIQTFKSRCDWLYYKKDYESAVKDYEQLLEMMKNKPKDKLYKEISESIILCYYKLKNYERVTNLINMNGEKIFRGRSGILFFILSDVKFQTTKDKRVCIPDLQQCINLNNNDIYAWSSLADIYYSQSEWYPCMKSYRILLQLTRNQAWEQMYSDIRKLAKERLQTIELHTDQNMEVVYDKKNQPFEYRWFLKTTKHQHQGQQKENTASDVNPFQL